jgi:L-ribulose-5-phosphate 4-epimerase
MLMKNHGVFAIGSTPQAAVKAAVMAEDVTRTVLYAIQLGPPQKIAADEKSNALTGEPCRSTDSRGRSRLWQLS